MHFRRERVRIETERHEIEGTIQLPHEGYRSRMTDFLNAHERDFLPLTDVEVRRLDDSRAIERHGFLALAVRHVVMVVELETLDIVDDTGGAPDPAPLAVEGVDAAAAVASDPATVAARSTGTALPICAWTDADDRMVAAAIMEDGPAARTLLPIALEENKTTAGSEQQAAEIARARESVLAPERTPAASRGVHAACGPENRSGSGTVR